MDLNFGVKTWYLRPTFVARVVYILISLVISIYLFNICASLSDSLFKRSVSNFPLVLAAFLEISILIALISFILLIFKVIPEYQYIALATNIISALVYILHCLIFVFSCCSDSYCKSSQEKVANYLNNNTQKKETLSFIKETGVVLPTKSENSIVIKYCYERSVGFSKVILGFSIAWLITAVLVYYSLLYTGQVSKLIAPEEKESQENLTNNVIVDI